MSMKLWGNVSWGNYIGKNSTDWGVWGIIKVPDIFYYFFEVEVLLEVPMCFIKLYLILH